LKSFGRMFASSLAMCVAAMLLRCIPVQAQNPNFHNAPMSAKEMKNPFEGQRLASEKPLYHLRCARCHGENGEGSGNIPALATGRAQSASDGELFWYITKGDVNNGMPSWSNLPRQQRWQIVTYIRVLGGSKPGSPRVRTTPAEGPVHGLPLREAREDSQGHIKGLARALRQRVGGQWPSTCAASKGRLAAGSAWIQGRALCLRP
jgi:hypothetical protein